MKLFAHRRMCSRCKDADVDHVMAYPEEGYLVVHSDMVHCSKFCDGLLDPMLHLHLDLRSRTAHRILELGLCGKSAHPGCLASAVVSMMLQVWTKLTYWSDLPLNVIPMLSP